MKPSVIVCPVELSVGSIPALAQARAFARWHDAELHVVHVSPRRRRGNTSTTTEGAEDSLSERLQALVRSVNQEGVKIRTAILNGDPVKALVEYTHLISADLCVVGQNGRSGSRHWPAGALAKDVAHALQCPTFMVPREFKADADATASFSNIVCGVDFSPASDVAVNRALRLAQQSGGRVTLLHVLEGFPSESVYSGSRVFRLIDEYRARVGRVRSQLRSGVPADALNWCDVDTEVVSGTPREAIVAVAIARRADLIVVGVSPRTKLHRIVMGSTIAGVLRRTRCAVLTVPSQSSAAETRFQSISVCGDENEAANAVMSPATVSITRGMSVDSAQGGGW